MYIYQPKRYARRAPRTTSAQQLKVRKTLISRCQHVPSLEVSPSLDNHNYGSEQVPQKDAGAKKEGKNSTERGHIYKSFVSNLPNQEAWCGLVNHGSHARENTYT